MESSLESLQNRLGYRFVAPALLTQALTHRSHGRNHNERLEFLGDSILNCAVAAMLYTRFGRYDEGDLSRLRSNLVKQQSLYEIAQALAISEVLVLGEGERRSGGLKRPSILADTVEAIVGAVFLDGGFNAAQGVIGRLYEPILKSVDPKTLGKDAKTLLQEYLQGKRIPLPVYEVVATHGAAHSQVFEVECSIPKLGVRVSGSGGSRRAAEQSAAKLALEEAMRRQPVTVRKTKAPVRGATSDADDEGTAKEAAAKEPADKDPIPKDPAQRDALQKDVAPKDVTPKDIAPKEPLHKDASSKDVAPREVPSKEAGRREVAAKDAAAKDSAGREEVRKSGVPTEAAPRAEPVVADPTARDGATARVTATRDEGGGDPVARDNPLPARRPREASSRDPLPLGELMSPEGRSRQSDLASSRREPGAQLASGAQGGDLDGEPAPVWQLGRS